MSVLTHISECVICHVMDVKHRNINMQEQDEEFKTPNGLDEFLIEDDKDVKGK